MHPDITPTPLRILHLEDNPTDAELVRQMLLAEGIACTITCVKTGPDFEAALERGQFDLILSDFSLPQFDGLSALTLARSKCPHKPLIFLSGTMGEEVAVESLKQGATDYVLKDRLARLPAAVRRAMSDAKESLLRQEAEAALRVSEERLQLVARATSDAVWDRDLLTNTLWLGPGFKIFGYNSQDLAQGLEFWSDHIHPEERAEILKGFEITLARGGQVWSAEYRFRCKDGSWAFVYDRAYMMRDAAGRAIRMVGAMMDITARKSAEQRIREQAALLDKAQDAIYVRDLNQRILYWNKSAERVYGWTAEEALGRNANELLYKEVPSQVLQAQKLILQRGEWLGEIRQVTKTGEPVVVESRWTLVRDESGRPAAQLVINTNVTERKKLEAQFLRAQRMETIGALAGGIAHDLNNALAPILMGVELLRDELATEQGRQVLETMHSSAQRGAEMVKQILSFARGVAGEPAPLQFRHLITEIKKFARETFPRSIRIETRIGANLFPVLGNATQLHQVLLNLCVNARDAMPDGGVLTIAAEGVLLDRAITPVRPEPISGPHVMLCVSDTGHGIPPELLGKVFEPFFTTKESGKGTGLGLSTVEAIAKSHGGYVEVASSPGQGATFKVFLPAAPEPAPHALATAPANLPMGHGEQILVADDELAILELTRETLESFNYRVLTAKDGAEALSVYQRHKEQVRAVITDMMMPVMDGPTTIGALRKIDPSIRVIGVSGLGSDSMLMQAGKLAVDNFLKKPYRTEDLLTTLREVLEK